MQLTFLVTSPRVAPGLMSGPAWAAISSADLVLAADASLPVFRAVTAAGHHVDVLLDPTAADLLDAATSGNVVWLASDAESTSLAGGLAVEIVAAGDADRPLPDVEILHGSYDVPGARLLDLVTVMDRLRAECPWDAKQTHRSLARYLLEESYETLEAIETGDSEHLREELGDLLLQVYFHAQIASEDDPDSAFNIDDVAGGIVDKLVHRHPHVFAREQGADEVSLVDVEASWETIKDAEKRRDSVLEGIPWALPALALADKVVRRAAKAGVDVSATDGGIGDQLLRLVIEARAAGEDAEQALRDAVRRLTDSVRDAERP